MSLQRDRLTGCLMTSWSMLYRCFPRASTIGAPLAVCDID